MKKGIFVAGIGTGVGKTIIATALTAALRADYWKPVQSGSIEGTDSDFARQYLSERSTVHPESYCLKEPLSPHAAAELEGVSIDQGKIEPPITENCLVIEGAGGLLVPLNHRETMLDLVTRFRFPVLLVARQYLGSINHSLLSIEALRARDIPILGIVFNGVPQKSSQEAIVALGGVSSLACIPEYPEIDASAIAEIGMLLIQNNVVADFAQRYA